MTAIIDGTNGVTTPNVLTSSSGVALTLQSGGTTAVTINTSQNVGIGTTSPATNLEVVNSAGDVIRVSNGTQSLNLGMNNGSGGSYLFENGANALRFGTNGTERMRVNAGAPILCLAGGSTSATGTGIAFPATQSASTNANTLDDYEEGTWTPAFTPNGGGSATISSAAGTYVKVGKTVTVYWSVYIASVTGATGTAGIGGLPFTTNDSGGGGANRAAIGIVREDGSTGYAYQWYLNSNGTSGTVLSLTNLGVVWTVGYIYDGSLTYIASA